jgi:hypothetical protein
MAVLMTLEVPGGTTAQYDRANEIIGIAGDHDAPSGLIVHACAVTDDGIVVVDVWDSVNTLDEFAQDRLGPAFAEAGMPAATPHISPVHELVFGTGEEPNVLVLLHTTGGTAEEYDTLVARMPSHAGTGESHPAVIHVAAAEPDGMHVASLWDSEDAYREFAERQLFPAIDNPRHFVLRIWPVHNCLRAQPRADA